MLSHAELATKLADALARAVLEMGEPTHNLGTPGVRQWEQVRFIAEQYRYEREYKCRACGEKMLRQTPSGLCGFCEEDPDVA